MQFCVFRTDWGWCSIGWTASGVCYFSLPEGDKDAVEKKARRKGGARTAEIPKSIVKVIEQVRVYFKDEGVLGKPTWDKLKVDCSHATPFFQLVWKETAKIPVGQTVSYGDLAKKVGRPKAARAVGMALGRNPVPLLVPCHRVFSSTGKPTGFSAPGGITTKLRLMDWEKAV